MALEIDVPPYFLCPISLQIMKDPVTVSTGITYDRESIEKWVFTNNNNICPVTKQALVDNDVIMTPNHTLRRLIQSWCTLNAVERFPTPKPPVTKAEITKIFKEATNFPQKCSACLNKIKCIAFESDANKRSLEAAGAVEFLSRIVIQDSLHSKEALGVLSLLRISEDQLRGMLVEEKGRAVVVLDSLVLAMQHGGYEARAWAVELMKSLMHVMEPAQMAGFKKNHFEEVVRVLQDHISLKVTKSALKVLTLACPWGRSRNRVVEAGAVPILVELMLQAAPGDRRLCEMILVVLDQLCRCPEGRAELVGHPAGLAVVSKKILRVSHFATEKGVRILTLISRFSGSPAVLQEMVQLGAVTKLCMVLQVDSEAKTKEMAREILKLHARAWRGSPCAPAHVFSSLPC